MKIFFYDEEMYDLDPNYDESNAELDSYEREADYYESERAEGVTVKNYADTNLHSAAFSRRHK